MRKIIVSFCFFLPLVLSAVDNFALLKDFSFPDHELKSLAAPFYGLVANGDAATAMNYVKVPPHNFVGALDSIKRELESRNGVSRIVSLSWKSYPQWETPRIWVVVGLMEQDSTLVYENDKKSYKNYQRVFTDVWVKEGNSWKMVPEDYVRVNVDVYFEDYLVGDKSKARAAGY